MAGRRGPGGGGRPRQVHHQRHAGQPRSATRRPRVGATIAGGRRHRGACGAAGPGSWRRPTRATARCSTSRPRAAILLNVDHDHHATFATLEEVREVFRAFVARLPADGRAGGRARRRGARAARPAAPCAVRLVGDVPGRLLPGRARPGAPGLHAGPGRRPARAGAAAAAAGPQRRERGLRPGARRLVRRRPGGRRRAPGRASPAWGGGWSARGTAGGVEVVDDYAHHPAEIRATLAAARERGAGRVVVVFQPHLPSRTRALAAELGEALGAADVVVVTEVYLAREPADPARHGTRRGRPHPSAGPVRSSPRRWPTPPTRCSPRRIRAT